MMRYDRVCLQAVRALAVCNAQDEIIRHRAVKDRHRTTTRVKMQADGRGWSGKISAKFPVAGRAPCEADAGLLGVFPLGYEQVRRDVDFTNCELAHHGRITATFPMQLLFV